MTITKAPVERGCGTRVLGGIYLVVDTCSVLNELCRPLFYFIVDPPAPLSSLPVSHIGTTIVPSKGTHHVIDVVGASHYPNVADFIQEAGKLGISRRVTKITRFGDIGPGSKLLLAHDKAIITNVHEYHAAISPTRTMVCVTAKHRFEEADPGMCASYWWNDVVGGQRRAEYGDPFLVERTIGSTTYYAHHKPDGVTPTYAIGFFMRVPLSRIEVVNDPVRGTHEEAMMRASAAGIEVDLVPY